MEAVAVSNLEPVSRAAFCKLQGPFRLVIVVSFFLVFLLFSGVSTVSSLLFVSIVLVQLLVGLLVRRWIGAPDLGDFGNLAVSFAIGAFFSVVSHLVFLTTPIDEIGWLVPLAAASVLFGIQRKNRVEQTATTEWWHSFFVIASITLIALGRIYKWHLPFGVALFIIALGFGFWEHIQSKATKRFVLLGISAISTPLVFLGVGYVQTRSKWWWTINSDITFTEGAMQSLGRWGFADHVAALGKTDLGTYHWFPFAWAGLADRVSYADAWWITTRATHLVFVFASVALIWALLRECFGLTKIYAQFGTLIAGLIGLSIGANFSGMVGVFWSIALIAVYFESEQSNSRFGARATLGLTALGLLYSKPQFAVPLIGGLIAAEVWRVVRLSRRHTDFGVIVALVGSLVVFGVTQILLEGDNVKSSGAIRLDLVSVGSFGELGNARNLMALPLVAVALLSWLLPAVASIVLIWRSGNHPKLLLVAGPVLCSSVAALVVTDALYQTLPGYLIGMLYLITALLVGAVLPIVTSSLVRNRILFLLVGVVLVPASLIARRWPTLFNPEPTGSVVDMALRTLAGARWIPLVVLAVGAAVLLRALQRGSKSSPFIWHVSLIFVVLTFNPVLVADRSINLLTSNETVSDTAETGVVALDNDVELLKGFVKELSNGSDIFASNVFCEMNQEVLCGEISWWSEYVQVHDQTYVGERCYNTLFFATDWSLPAVLDRRFLVQGPHMFAYCRTIPAWLSERVIQSEEFGRRPSAKSFGYMCDQGVKWFIADRTFNQDDSWAPYGDVVVRADRLVLIRLRSDTCPDNLA